MAGTLCKGEIQGEMASKIGDCLQCDFFQLVTEEEREFVLIPQVASAL